MPIQYGDAVATLSGACAVEEAEALLAWLDDHDGGGVDVQDLAHLHCAVLQVLMARRPPCVGGPRDAEVALWLGPLLADPGIPSH